MTVAGRKKTTMTGKIPTCSVYTALVNEYSPAALADLLLRAAERKEKATSVLGRNTFANSNMHIYTVKCDQMVS